MADHNSRLQQATREVIIVGGGFAGISAAIYLGRALRDTLLIDAGGSLGAWEPRVENYLGFPGGISGEKLLHLGRQQAARFHIQSIEDHIDHASEIDGVFQLQGRKGVYRSQRLLLATGLFHLPPELPGIGKCIGHSIFFCKDCDGFRVRGKRLAILGRNNEAVEYALGMLLYSPCVVIATNGEAPQWDEAHAAWVAEYEIPVFRAPVAEVRHDEGMISCLRFADGESIAVDSAFTTRGDIYHNSLARDLGAECDATGQIRVNDEMKTNIDGLYAAGCVTPANCQMIIAAGEGATAAQAINRSLFEEILRTHKLRPFRSQQIAAGTAAPDHL